ncbi:MAG: hypothetical protein MUP53_05735 [Bacteroidales bacterium]|nr:hypothetical protein [Bacteroidales bacterium]
MKKVVLLSAVITMILLPCSIINGQDNCKVLIPRIGDSYKGSCKNGLADGRGEAFGVDQYNGDFKKGYPDGNGTYIWQSGDRYEGDWRKGLRDGKGTLIVKYMGRDSVLAGVWKQDTYLGKEVLPPYVIKYRNGVGRISFMKFGDTPYYIKFKFTRGGETTGGNVTGLLLTGNTGNESMTTTFTGYENVTFPFEGKVKFTAPNAFNTAEINCEVRFVINQPGAWVMTIFY